jgi:hypothetical protein
MIVSTPFQFKVQCDGKVALIVLAGTVCPETRGDLLRLQSEIKELKQEWAIFDFTALADPSGSLFVDFFRILSCIKRSNIKAFFVDSEGDIIVSLTNWGIIRPSEIFNSVTEARQALAPKLLTAGPVRLLLKSAA